MHCYCMSLQSCIIFVLLEQKKSGRPHQHQPQTLKLKVECKTAHKVHIHKVQTLILILFKASFSCNMMPNLFDTSGSSDRESSLELIKLDISRTFPQLCIFQQVSEKFGDHIMRFQWTSKGKLQFCPKKTPSSWSILFFLLVKYHSGILGWMDGWI